MKINFYNDITKSDLQYIEEIKQLTEDDELIINFNSAGGLCDVGLHLYNVIKNSPAKTIGIVEGFCASIASYILMACKQRIGYSNSIIMVHRPWCQVAGNAMELKKEVDALSTYSSALELAYIENSKITDEEIKSMLDNETYLTADEALKIGFLTTVEGDFNKDTKSSITAKALHDIIMKANLKVNSKQEFKNMDIQIEKIEDVITILSEMAKNLNEEYANQINAIVEYISTLEQTPVEETPTEETTEEEVVNAEDEQQPEEKEEVAEEQVEEQVEETPEEEKEEVVAEDDSSTLIEEMKKEIEELKKQLSSINKPMNYGTFTVISGTSDTKLSARETFNKLYSEDREKADAYWKANKHAILHNS